MTHGPSLYVLEKSKQKSTALLAHTVLAMFADPITGEATPSIPDLARWLRMKDRNTQELLRRLEDAGEITIEVNAGRPTGTGYTNRYTLVGYKEWFQAVVSLPDTNKQAVQLPDEWESQAVQDFVPAVQNPASLDLLGMQVPVVTPPLSGATLRTPAVQSPEVAPPQAVQDSVAEGKDGRDKPDESVESYTEIPDIPEKFSEDSTDSLPPKVLELTDVVFIDKPDKTGRQKVAWLIEKFGEPLVTAMLEHGAKLTGDARPVHVNWLVKSVKNAMLEGRTADQIRNRLGLRDGPPQQTYDYTHDDDPDTLSYRLTHGPPPDTPLPVTLRETNHKGMTIGDAWKATLEQLPGYLDNNGLMWIRGATLLGYQDGALCFEVRTDHIRGQLIGYGRTIKKVLDAIWEQPVELRFVVAEREGV